MGQLRVTPSAGQKILIEILSRGWEMPEAAVVMTVFSYGQGQAMAEFEQFQRLQGVPESPLRLLLLRFAAGEIVADAELALMAHDCGLPLEVLKQVRDCLVSEQGERANAPVS